MTAAAFVLVVSGFLGGYANGYSATTFQEFSSMGRCEAVAMDLKKWAGNSDKLFVKCVEK